MNVAHFVLGRVVGERENPSGDPNRYGAVALVARSPVQALVLATALARSEAPPERPTGWESRVLKESIEASPPSDQITQATQ